MEKGYTVRPYELGDEEKVVQLLALVFDGWPHIDLKCSPVDHWRWKFKDNPLTKPIVTVSISDDELIGCSHAIPLRYKILDKSVLCFNGVDVVVHSDFRRKGLRNRMMELKFKLASNAGIKYALLTSGNPILIESYRRHNIQFPHKVLNLVRIRNIDLQLQAMPVDNAWLIKLGFHIMKLFNKFKNIFNRNQFKEHGFLIKEITNFDKRIDEFWDEVSSHYNFIAERDLEYLNWRYCDTRAGDFTIKMIEENNRILGYSVLSINQHLKGYPVGFIVDLLAESDRLDVVNALIEDALNYFDSYDINVINYQVVKNHIYEKVLKKQGFLDSRITFYLFYHPLGEADEIYKLKSPGKSIFVSWGDQDVLPVRMPS